MTTTVDNEWQTLTEAAKTYDKSRQAIENLIKRGMVEGKNLGKRNILHVHAPTLRMYYADKATTTEPQQIKNNQITTQSSVAMQIELAECKADNNRLNQLLSMLQSEFRDCKHELQSTRKEFSDERKRNQELQQDLLKLTKEMQGILNKENGLMGWLRTKRV